MYHLVHRDSSIGHALLAGKGVDSAFPGHDPERWGTRQEAARHAGRDFLVVLASLTNRRNSNGDPLFRITSCEQGLTTPAPE